MPCLEGLGEFAEEDWGEIFLPEPGRCFVVKVGMPENFWGWPGVLVSGITYVAVKNKFIPHTHTHTILC